MECWWVVIMGCVAVMCYWFWLEREKRRLQKKGIPRGSAGWPFIGETLDFIACGYSSKPVSFMDKRKSLYGKVFKSHILGTPIIVSTDSELNKVILQNHRNAFVPAYPKTIRELLGENSILQMNGSLQKRLHALIGGFLRSPQFKSQIVRDIENSVKLTMASWGDRDGSILFQEEIKQITFGILVKVLMSIGPGEELEFMSREFEEFIKGLICLPIKLPGTRLYKSLKAKERLLKVVERIVEERKISVQKLDGNGETNDTLDVLLHDTDEANESRRFSSDFICGNIIEMMIPGEETVPMAMTLAVKFLTNSPEALKQLKEENMELKRQKTESLEEYSWMDYISLPFTQNVINETLRLANIINAVWRKSTKDVEIKGYLIPQGWCVLASFISVHMDEENYENPYNFNPWRWEKTGAAVNNSNFTPFGGGQRLCPGLELSRLEISVFLHHFVTTYSWAAEDDEIVYFPTVKMKRKLPIRVTLLTTI
ncbi:3-epi-6-deoxocathasterone 23-monooxygenase CYP90C1 [Punica granatum]|uniref:22alpha-hydroxysteroid 23-monooxygenase n=2 Tax=Punica granatum TaxID=22663 RepID=A0A6P8D6T5_PUNGR|nr:3-epi-6-deoxocathasterone 23-monooxygenase CYP90C1 [Punica granatum]XP_031389226.1 3-epi-6-deoxocathasterone 23-monooxygenase CYP90C1 [Punica granatum]